MLEFFVAFVTLFITVLYLLLLLEHSEDAVDTHTKTFIEWPFVSIIIPVFNEEGVISKTLKAILEMDYPRDKLEVIVVDDESKDATIAEIKTISDKRIKIIYNKHVGIGNSSAKNAGIKAAKGELIATVDSDSFPMPNALKNIVSHFTDKSVMAATAAIRVHKPKNILETIQSVEYALGTVSRRLIGFLDSVTVTPGPLSVYRRELFEKVGNFDTQNLAEDQELAFRIQSKNYKIIPSLSTLVYTQVPSTFSTLMSQRVRWNRGALKNYVHYRYMLSPLYGDFGVMAFPMAVLAVIVVFVGALTFLFNFISNPFASISYNVNYIFYGVNVLHIITAAILLITLMWVSIAKKLIEKDLQDLTYKKLALYLICHPVLMSIFWFASIYEEIRGKKRRW